MPNAEEIFAEWGIDADALERRWAALQERLREQFGQEVGVDGVLYLMGLHVQGRGFEPGLEKEEKQDLIMEGSYCALAALGFYEQVGMESEGSWIWARLRPAPPLDVDGQERLLRTGIVKYFETVWPA